MCGHSYKFQSFPHDLTKDYGKPYLHKTEGEGPLVKKRSCTDCVCLLAFVAFMGGWGFVAYLGMMTGDIRRVVYPTDSQVRV